MCRHVHQLPEQMARLLAPEAEAACLHNSTSLLDHLNDIEELLPNPKIFPADAVPMYTNIDTNHAIEVINKWLDKLGQEAKLCEGFLLTAIKEAMVLVMRNKSSSGRLLLLAAPRLCHGHLSSLHVGEDIFRRPQNRQAPAQVRELSPHFQVIYQ
ncbi:hypothetical protein ACHAWF_014662 [Thalassiosira exigua]